MSAKPEPEVFWRLTLGNGQGWAPLVTENVQANASIRVDVWVIDTGGEIDFRRLEGVIGREVYIQEEDTTRVGTITLVCVSQVPKPYLVSLLLCIPVPLSSLASETKEATPSAKMFEVCVMLETSELFTDQIIFTGSGRARRGRITGNLLA